MFSVEVHLICSSLSFKYSIICELNIDREPHFRVCWLHGGWDAWVMWCSKCSSETMGHWGIWEAYALFSSEGNVMLILSGGKRFFFVLKNFLGFVKGKNSRYLVALTGIGSYGDETRCESFFIIFCFVQSNSRKRFMGCWSHQFSQCIFFSYTFYFCRFLPRFLVFERTKRIKPLPKWVRSQHRPWPPSTAPESTALGPCDTLTVNYKNPPTHLPFEPTAFPFDFFFCGVCDNFLKVEG